MGDILQGDKVTDSVKENKERGQAKSLRKKRERNKRKRPLEKESKLNWYLI
jgi:hypothetical protein